MPLPQSSYDARRSQQAAERAVPAVHPDPRVLRAYELLGQMRVAMAEISNLLGDLRDVNARLRAEHGPVTGDDEDLFRGEVSGT